MPLSLLRGLLLDSFNLYGKSFGTPGYMAPEQFEKNSEIGIQADIYGLGCILYSLLTYLRPIEGNVDTTYERIKAGKILNPAERCPGKEIPKALNAVVQKAMAIEADDRYGSSKELHDEIERHLTGFATLAEKASILTLFKLFYVRNKAICLSSFFLSFVILVGTVYSIVSLYQKEKVATQARDMAEKNAHEALLAKEESERALRLYTEGQYEFHEVFASSIEAVIEAARKFQHSKKYHKAEALLKDALSREPDHKLLNRELAEHYLIQHKFDVALPYFAKGIHKNGQVHGIAKKRAEYLTTGEEEGEGILPVDQFIEILNLLKSRDSLALRMMDFYWLHCFDLNKRAKIIKKYIENLNPEWTDGWFEYDFDLNVLRMGGKGLKRISSSKSVLKALQPRTLDLSHSEVSNLRLDTELSIEVLNVVNTRIDKTSQVKRLPYLRKLILTKGQIDESKFKRISDYVNIIEVVEK